MIRVTHRAAERALALAEKEGKPPLLRVGVRGGGCTGLSYFLDFVETPRVDDTRLEVSGLTVLCDPKSLQFIEGTELDFETNLMNRGFRFNNPRAKQSCSCGESFTV